MIFATSFDIQVLSELDNQHQSPKDNYFVILKVDGDQEIQSGNIQRVAAPGWQEEHSLQFDVRSTIKIEIFRKSPKRLSRKHSVAKYTGLGIDLLANDHELLIESVDQKGPRISIKLDLVVEDHEQFMKAVDEDMGRLAKVKGADAAQTVITIGAVLKNIVPIIDTFTGSHPVLNAAWIVLSSAYKVIQKQSDLDDAVRQLVEILREMAGQAAACPNLLEIPGTINVIAEIGRTSLHVAWLIHRYADPSIRGKPSMLARAAKHSVSDMSSQVGELKTRCATLNVTLQWRVQIDTNVRARVIEDSVKDTSVRVRGIQDAQKEDKINTWLCAPDSSPNYNAAREKHQAETGSWFIDGSEFKEWKEEPGRILWLEGGPGCGKTITCATSIKNVIDSCASKPSGVGYAYFFFDGTSARTELRSHESLLKSIIRQLAGRCDGIPVALDEMYRACNNGGSQPDRPLLENTLLGIVNGFDVAAYIVIDSLDECAERPKVLKWIQSITSTTAGKLHMLVTSRPEWDIKENLLSLAGIHQISIADYQGAKEDIRRLIDGRLSELPEWREERKKKVGDVLMRDANGMFRWVALQFDALKECESDKELDKQLRSLPKDLNDTYAGIFERSTRSDVLKRFLQWLAYSREAMTVQEIAEVALIDFDSAVPVYDAEQRYDPNAVLRICSGLISEVGGTLKLAHFSVNEYLASLDITDAAHGVAVQNRTSECTSHAIIATTCLAYLQHFDKPGSITAANIVSFPLARYAAKHWDSHFHSARTDINHYTALQNLVVDLFRPATPCALINWIQIRDKQFHLETDTFAAPLYYACRFGLTEAAQFLIDRGADINAGAASFTALMVASSNKPFETAELWGEKGARLDTEGGAGYGRALQAASCYGHFEIVKLLVENGADLNAEGRNRSGNRYQYGTPLVLAALNGDFESVKILVAKRALLDIEGGETSKDNRTPQYGTALVLASLRGHSNIVKILAEKKAHLETNGGETVIRRRRLTEEHSVRNGTALVLASLRGHSNIVKILAENGALLETKGEEILRGHFAWRVKSVRNGTALVLASLQGNFKIVKILVEKGARLDTEGEEKLLDRPVWRCTALKAASAKGHWNIAELLSEAASDRAALQAAEGGEALAEIPAVHEDDNGHE